jgi:hypothetical protein
VQERVSLRGGSGASNFIRQNIKLTEMTSLCRSPFTAEIKEPGVYSNLRLLATKQLVKFVCPLNFFVLMAQQPLVGQGVLCVEASRSHSDTAHSVGLLWTSDQPDAETSALTAHNNYKRQTSMPPAGFEPKTPASDRAPSYALDRAATGIDAF